MRLSAWLSVVFLSMAGVAQAQQEQRLGPAIRGVTVILEADGTLSLALAPRIALSDGRVLERGADGKYALTAESTASPREFSGLDFGLFASELEGQRVRVTGGRIFGADINRGLLSIQGGSVGIDFAGTDRLMVREMVQRCSSILTGPACHVVVTGTVAPPGISGTPRLQRVVIERSGAD